MGVLAWPMVEFEADDALAAAAHRANLDAGVRQVSIWTPDKDLAQCVVGDRVVQVDRRSGQVRNAAGVLEKFGVPPSRIPDYLALVGDSADGYPGIAGIGAKTAARLLTKHGAIEDFPGEVLGDQREDALLYKRLATLRTDVPVFMDIDELRWKGPRPEFDRLSRELGASHLAAKVAYLARNG
jgi:5'-3' exonuclease